MKHKIEHKEIINGITYQTLTEEYIDEVVDFYFDVFLKDEPTTIAAGGYHDRDANIIKQVGEIIDDGVSIIALHGTELVGMMVSHTVSKSQVEPRSTFEENAKVFPELHASIMTLFDEIMYPGDIFEKYPEDTKFYDMFTLATKGSFRGRGIGKNCVEQSLKLAKKANCSAAIVLATSDLTRKILAKTGFEIIAAKNWQDCIYNGKTSAFGRVVPVPSENATAHYLKL